jgi:uncharacterized membrane protein (UPF0127 family)
VKYVRAENVIRRTVLGTRIGVADRWWLRLAGLLGRERLAPGEGLCLRPCRAVHMLGMSQSLDVAFLDPSGRVVAIYPGLSPGDRTGWHSKAREALELPPGTLAATGTREGDTIVCSTEEIS